MERERNSRLRSERISFERVQGAEREGQQKHLEVRGEATGKLKSSSISANFFESTKGAGCERFAETYNKNIA